MKIIQLSTYNIASLEGKNHIDFTIGPLASCKIFSIVGPTGSGKSTLLDAICLALYGKAPRYNASLSAIQKDEEGDGKSVLRSNDVRNIMTRGSKQCYCHLIFEANDHRLYQAEWSTELKRTNYATAKNLLREVTRSATGEFIFKDKEENRKTEEVIGLQYEQFVRTVLLAQGAFDGFLKAESNEKSVLLERLTGITIYQRIAERIRIHHEEAKQRKLDIDSRIGIRKEQLIEDEEEVNELTLSIEKEKEETARIVQLNKTCTRQLQWWNEEEKLNQTLLKTDLRIKQIEAELERMAEKREWLQLYDAAHDALAYISASEKAQQDYSRFSQKAQEAYKTEQALQAQLNDSEKALTSLKQKEQEAAAHYEQMKPRIQQAQNLQTEINQLKELEAGAKQEVNTCRKAQEDNEKEIASSQKKIQSMRERYLKATKELDALKELHANAVEEKINQTKNQEQAYEQLLNKWKEVDGEQLQRSRDRAFTVRSVGSKIAEMRKQLEEGQKCPVCGATEHPDAAHDILHLADFKDELERDFSEKEQALANYNQAMTHLQQLQQTLSKAESETAKLKEKQQKEVEQKQKEINELVMEGTALKASCTERERMKEEKENALKTALMKYNQLTEQSTEKQAAFNQLLKGKTVKEVEETLTRALKKATDELSNLKDSMAKLQSELSAAHAAFTNHTQESMNSQAQAAEMCARIDQWLTAYNADDNKPELTKEKLLQLAHEDTNWNALRERINKTVQEKVAAKTLFDKATHDLEVHSKDKPEQDKERINLQLQETDQQLQTSTEKLGRLTARLNSHQEALKAIGELAEQSVQANADATDWALLYKAIGGNKEGKLLRQIAQCVTLSFLVKHANKQLRLFNQRYSLKQLENTLTLRIVDHERGDEERVVSSLSGGETFIVSLALALALSDLSSRNVAFKNLFIDEGFGTLDQDSLHMVIDALATLQSEQGKTVGVISHTAEMSAGISTQICITPTGNGCSRLQVQNTF